MIFYELIIIDNDKQYSDKFVEFIRKHYNNRFNVIRCIDKTNIHKYINNDKTVFLINEESYEKLNHYLEGNPLVFILSSQDLNNKKNYIFKYQKVDKIIKKIIGILAEIHGESYFSEDLDYKNVIGIYSPIGGIGKTTTAIILSSIIAQHQSVFYLNLEHFPGVNQLLKSETKYNLSDFIYYAMKDNIDLSLKVDSMKNKENHLGFYYFNAHNTKEDIIDTDKYIWRKIIRTLSNNFDWVIIDFDSSYDTKNQELLELCNDKIIIASDNIIAKEKFKKWYLYSLKQKNICNDNIVFIANKCISYTDYDFFIKKEPDLIIEYDKKYTKGQLNEMLHGDFADKISVIYELFETKG